ncbi:M28 family peptidase [Marinoscillum sp.]|uniref:M28 family peptidase n=1 Tax=Marinoscillum sp. TaxID=2024838 RepID=UPI003BAB5A3B
MRSIQALIIALFLVACEQAQNPTEIISQDIAILASDSLEGREVGTEGERKAASYIAGRFKELGLSPKGTAGFMQSFFVKDSDNPHEKATMSDEDTLQGISGRNVVAFQDNPGDQLIIIGAHYDHLGYGGLSSLHRGDSAIHNGADDNASGVSAMLEIARYFQTNPINSDILYIGFSGEEKGLWGSNYFAKNPTVDLTLVNYMINMDMVGRLDTAKGIAIHGTGTAPVWSEIIDQSNTVGLKVVKKESGVGPSDHTSFYLQDIPVLHFFTGQHGDYHKPTDDSELINVNGILKITTHIENIVKNLDTEPKLTFQKTKDESSQGPRFTVTLGVVPDYLFDGEGMRIDGISEDKPAQKAGLEQGDIVIQLGDSTIIDMMSYMRALSAFNKGDSTQVVINRNGEELTYDISF